jgi:hypothetical protein
LDVLRKVTEGMKLHKKRQIEQTLKDDNESLFQCVDLCFCINYAVFNAANMAVYSNDFVCHAKAFKVSIPIE